EPNVSPEPSIAMQTVLIEPRQTPTARAATKYRSGAVGLAHSTVRRRFRSVPTLQGNHTNVLSDNRGVASQRHLGSSRSHVGPAPTEDFGLGLRDRKMTERTGSLTCHDGEC